MSYGYSFELVNEFKYLGVSFDYHGTSKHMIGSIIAKAR